MPRSILVCRTSYEERETRSHNEVRKRSQARSFKLGFGGPMSSVLQFGIPSLDALFGRPCPTPGVENAYDYASYGIRLSDGNQATSLSIIGPDGTGKSVFGLH